MEENVEKSYEIDGIKFEINDKQESDKDSDSSSLDDFEIDSSKVEVNTVDGFQGQEKDIIIFNCVRSNQIGEIGFLND